VARKKRGTVSWPYGPPPTKEIDSEASAESDESLIDEVIQIRKAKIEE
jgi:hypothetical protein